MLTQLYNYVRGNNYILPSKEIWLKVLNSFLDPEWETTDDIREHVYVLGTPGLMSAYGHNTQDIAEIELILSLIEAFEVLPNGNLV